jgi:hypothetical protein
VMQGLVAEPELACKGDTSVTGRALDRGEHDLEWWALCFRGFRALDPGKQCSGPWETRS